MTFARDVNIGRALEESILNSLEERKANACST